MIKDFTMTNEALRKIFGGQQEGGSSQFFSFNGTNAVEEARQITNLTRGGCGCGCGCAGGGGSGGGSGAPAAMLK